MGCFPTEDMQTPPIPSEVAILTQKMRNVTKKKMGVKFHHITSYRVWALRAFKRGVQKKWENMANIYDSNVYPTVHYIVFSTFYCGKSLEHFTAHSKV